MSEQYTKSNLRHIAEYLVEELREMPDGTEITSGQLLKVGGYDPQEFEFSDLMDYHQYLFRAAKASHITLDMSKHENKVEGLPFNLDFVVHNKKGQIKCPYCGSKNTARILYGMPVFSDELQAKLDSGKLHLGGCCISGVRDSNGSMIALDPERYCNDCHKEFARPPYLVAKDLSDAEAYCDIVTGIKFSYGGFFMGHTEIVLKKNAAIQRSCLKRTRMELWFLCSSFPIRLSLFRIGKSRPFVGCVSSTVCIQSCIYRSGKRITTTLMFWMVSNGHLRSY